MPLASIADLQNLDAPDLILEASELSNKYMRYLASAADTAVRHPGIHASEISKCYRQAVYTMRAEPKHIVATDPNEAGYWKKVMNHGHSLHDMVQGHFYKMAKDRGMQLDFQAEVPIHPETSSVAAKWNIHSSCDGVFTFWKRDPATWNKEVHLRIGLEIKSSKDSIFEKRKEPEPAHIEQVHVYMASLDLPLFWVMYYNKNTESITPSTPPWLVLHNPRLWAKLEARFAGWHQHLANKTLPEAMPGIHCKFCPYTKSCNPPAVGMFMPKPKLVVPRSWKNLPTV